MRSGLYVEVDDSVQPTDLPGFRARARACVCVRERDIHTETEIETGRKTDRDTIISLLFSRVDYQLP